jgi:hypothetical protein
MPELGFQIDFAQMTTSGGDTSSRCPAKPGVVFNLSYLSGHCINLFFLLHGGPRDCTSQMGIKPTHPCGRDVFPSIGANGWVEACRQLVLCKGIAHARCWGSWNSGQRGADKDAGHERWFTRWSSISLHSPIETTDPHLNYAISRALSLHSSSF